MPLSENDRWAESYEPQRLPPNGPTWRQLFAWLLLQNGGGRVILTGDDLAEASRCHLCGPACGMGEYEATNVKGMGS